MMRRCFPPLLVPLFFLSVSAIWLTGVILHPDQLLIWRGAEYSDILVSHWPNAYYIKHSLHTSGQIPLWNSMIFSGTPFAADPLSGLWYPPNWLTIILPIQIAFNFLFLLHLAWTGWGMFRWMKELGVGTAAALVAGLAWCGVPKWFAHIGLGHFSFVCAVSWTPWVLQSFDRALRVAGQGWKNWFRWSGLTGVMIGFSYLADPRWSVPLGLICLAYMIRHIIKTRTVTSNGRMVFTTSKPVLAVGSLSVVVAIGLAAILIWPFLELVFNSSRSMLATQDMTVLSLPFSHLVGIIFPFFDQPEWLAYAGFGVLQLTIIALISGRVNARFWLGVVIVSWLLALGENFPMYRVLTEIIPGMKLLRVPPRFNFLASFGLSILTGLGFEQFVLTEWRNKKLATIRLSSLGLTALVVSIGIGLCIVAREGSALVIGIGFLAIATFLWIQISTRRQIRPRLASLLWILIISVDYILVGSYALELQPLEEKLAERSEIVDFIGNSQGTRFFSPSYSLPQQTTARYQVEMADGVNPLQLQSYKEYLASAVGFSVREYSVSLPPYPAEGPRQPQELDIDAEKLGLLNVGMIVSDYPIEALFITPEAVIDGVYVYRNEKMMPRVWMLSEDSKVGFSEIDIALWTPNRIQLSVEGPGRLILSEVDYPGWQVEIDGVSTELQRRYDLFRSVEIPDGQHEVGFMFDPLSVHLGGVISLLTLLSIVLLWIKR